MHDNFVHPIVVTVKKKQSAKRLKKLRKGRGPLRKKTNKILDKYQEMVGEEHELVPLVLEFWEKKKKGKKKWRKHPFYQLFQNPKH